MSDRSRVWEVYFDGLCEPRNPGGVMAWGWAVVEPQTGELFTGSDARAAATGNTNNVAEYFALGFALKFLRTKFTVAIEAAAKLKGAPFGGAPIASAGYAGLIIRGDSKLVVEQVNGRWAVNAGNLKPLHGRCRELLADLNLIGPWQLEWVPRIKNKLADEKSREGYRKLTGHEAPVRFEKGKDRE